MAFCTKCGAELAEGTRFCVKCGTPAGGAATGAASRVQEKPAAATETLQAAPTIAAFAEALKWRLKWFVAGYGEDALTSENVERIIDECAASGVALHTETDKISEALTFFLRGCKELDSLSSESIDWFASKYELPHNAQDLVAVATFALEKAKQLCTAPEDEEEARYEREEWANFLMKICKQAQKCGADSSVTEQLAAIKVQVDVLAADEDDDLDDEEEDEDEDEGNDSDEDNEDEDDADSDNDGDSTDSANDGASLDEAFAEAAEQFEKMKNEAKEKLGGMLKGFLKKK